ncbi:hypothetical protein BDZ89DRAFT_1144682 [Hymenopellis radicata]|nr:hypothetical protein BDZ89DRAFT_1144682 [Hymenopellis radicata]
MSETTTTAWYLRRTGEWIVLGGLHLIVESIASTVVLACLVALLIVQRARKRRRSSPMIFIFSAMFALVSLNYAIDLFWFFIQARDILLQAVGDEGKITPAEKALKLNAKKYVNVLLVVGNGCWLVSVVLGDLVVFWRAWELSSHNVTAKRILVCAGAVLLSCIGIEHPRNNFKQWGSSSYAPFTIGTIPVILVCQLQSFRTPLDSFCGKELTVVNWCLSLLSNLLSTSVITYIGWSHRTEMRKLFQSHQEKPTLPDYF